MANQPTVLAFVGSTRSASYNKMLVKIAASAARDEGAAVTVIDLRDLPMPLFDQDLEAAAGLPANAVKFRELMLAHQGLLIAAPEYNSSITAVLKNAIDWASRPAPGQAPLACFNDKVAALLSASPGALGGLRGLVHLRSILGNINVLVLPDQFAVTRAAEAFNPDGTLKDPRQHSAVAAIAQKLVRILGKLHG
jgi:NAD(P)H-dependent FMN reductase